MGRPINKKFFANLIDPYQDHATGGPTGQSSGEGVANVVVTDPGTYTTLPGVSFSAPTMLGGVRTAGTASELTAVSATIAVASNGTVAADYKRGDVLTVSGGTASAAATFSVGSSKVVAVEVTTATTPVNFVSGDLVYFGGANWSTSATIAVYVDGTGAITGTNIVNAGVYIGTTVPATFTPTATNGTGTDLTVDLGLGVNTITLVSGGTYTAVAANARPTTVNTGTGAGATLNVTYGVKTVAVTTTGSGYSSAPTVTFSTGTAAATAYLTNVSTGVIAATGYLTTGTQALPVDIMKQEASRRYLVRNTQGQGQCKLVTTTLTPGTMTITAKDAAGNSYFVKKLTARRVTLIQIAGGSNYEFANNESAGWTLGAASAGIVSIASY